MSENLTYVGDFLGKYSLELMASLTQPKYENSKLETLFRQRFRIQNNKVQMIIDASMDGLSVMVVGNEVYVSKELFDHPDIVINNSMESPTALDSKNMYSPNTFSTISHLMCQNHTTFHILNTINEPIYVRYVNEYETFYTSLISFNLSPGINVEVVEEIASLAALNSVVNYLVGPSAKLNLVTFYQNNISSTSVFYRSIIAQQQSTFNHTLFGKGSATVVDENCIFAMDQSVCKFNNLIDSDNRHFRSILLIEPVSDSYNLSVVNREIVTNTSNVSSHLEVSGYMFDRTLKDSSSLNVECVPDDKKESMITDFVHNFEENVKSAKMAGHERFYQNKTYKHQSLLRQPH